MSSELFQILESKELDTNLEEEIWQKFGVHRAVLVMDSTGFSRVTRKKGILHFLSIIEKLRKISGEQFEKNNALRFRFEADNCYAEFESVRQAFTAAKEVNRILTEKKIPLVGDEFFGVCTGIGFGNCLDADHEGLYGDEMNLASKLGEDTADAREILLTPKAFQHLDSGDQEKLEKKNVLVSGVDLTYYQFTYS